MYINYTCIDGHLCLLPIINIWHNKKYSILFYSNYFLWYFNIFLFMLVREIFLFPSVTRCVPYLCRHCHLFNGNVYLWFIMIFLRTMSQYIGNVYRLSPCISRMRQISLLLLWLFLWFMFNHNDFDFHYVDWTCACINTLKIISLELYRNSQREI